MADINPSTTVLRYDHNKPLIASTYSSSTTYRMLTILNGGGASSCTLTGLQPYTLYELFIVPFYKSVEGKPSNSHIARTLEEGKSNILPNSVFILLGFYHIDNIILISQLSKQFSCLLIGFTQNYL